MSSKAALRERSRVDSLRPRTPRLPLYASDEVTSIGAERKGELRDGFEARIPLTTFERADVGPIDAGSMREFFLSHRELLSSCAHSIAEESLSGRSALSRASHGLIRLGCRVGVNRIRVTSNLSSTTIVAATTIVL
jgi:hypothetical protein